MAVYHLRGQACRVARVLGGDAIGQHTTDEVAVSVVVVACLPDGFIRALRDVVVVTVVCVYMIAYDDARAGAVVGVVVRVVSRDVARFALAEYAPLRVVVVIHRVRAVGLATYRARGGVGGGYG